MAKSDLGCPKTVKWTYKVTLLFVTLVILYFSKLAPFLLCFFLLTLVGGLAQVTVFMHYCTWEAIIGRDGHCKWV